MNNNLIKTMIWTCLFAVVSLSAVSCGDGEEKDVPSYADFNGFAPDDNDHSATAQIRRQFFEQTGSFLLFSDTLTTITPSGKPELLHVGYSIFSDGEDIPWEYAYIKDPAMQKKAADLVVKYIANKLGKTCPYSFLIVNDIVYPEYDMHMNMLTGYRAYVISMNGGEALEHPEEYFASMMYEFVTNEFNKLSTDETARFYDVSSEYYGRYVDEFGYEALTQQQCWDMGFFNYYEDWGALPYNYEDFELWVNAVLNYSPADFEAEYGSSEMMMRKYSILREMLADIGFSL